MGRVIIIVLIAVSSFLSGMVLMHHVSFETMCGPSIVSLESELKMCFVQQDLERAVCDQLIDKCGG